MFRQNSARIPKSVIENSSLAFVGEVMRNILLPVITVCFNIAVISLAANTILVESLSMVMLPMLITNVNASKSDEYCCLWLSSPRLSLQPCCNSFHNGTLSNQTCLHLQWGQQLLMMEKDLLLQTSDNCLYSASTSMYTLYFGLSSVSN